MEYLILQLLSYILTPILVALIIDFIVVEGRNDLITAFMILLGAFFGWISFNIFLWTQGGLGVNMIFLFIPVILVIFSSFFILMKLANIKIMFTKPRWKINKLGTFGAYGFLFLLVFVIVVFTFAPTFMAKEISVSSDFSIMGEFDGHDFKKPTNLNIPTSTIRASSSVSPSSNFINIESHRSYVKFPFTISANPQEDGYYNFEATFSVGSGGGDWTMPFVKIFIFKDNDNNGVLSSGDTYFSDLDWKFPTGGSSSPWLCNILYDGNFNGAGYEFNLIYIDGELTAMPIFRATLSNNNYNDGGKTVSNTPEGYNVPYDMTTWIYDSNANTVSCKDGFNGFPSVSKGTSAPSITGKVFCRGGTAGNYGIVYQAFDARYHEIWDNSAVPLGQKIDLFTIIDEDDPDHYCGDGVCDSDETASSCPDDCGSDPDPPVVTIVTTNWVSGVALLSGLSLFGYAVVKSGFKYLKK